MGYTARAENNLLDAWLFLAADNQNAADCLIETVNQEATQLLAHPRDGSEAPGVGERHSDVANLDAIPVVLLFYCPDSKEIIVARVLHHARDIESIASWPRQ